MLFRSNEGDVCDGVDNDCDGAADEGLGGMEGFPIFGSCNGRDDDCDGSIDEDFPECFVIPVGGPFRCENGLLVLGCPQP